MLGCSKKMYSFKYGRVLENLEAKKGKILRMFKHKKVLHISHLSVIAEQ